MSSVVTVTISPCIDKTITVAQIFPDRKLRCDQPFVQPGGGGINVATVLNRLGINATAVFISGGYAGGFLRHLLDAQHIPYISIEGKQETRENIVIHELSTGKQYRFTMPCGHTAEAEWRACFEAVSLKTAPAYIVISGSMPDDLSPAFFEEFATFAKNKNAQLIIDTSGAALKNALQFSPFLIKPNLGELANLTGVEISSAQQAELAAKALIKNYECKNIVVSLADKGAMMVTKDATYFAKPPKVTVKSTVGAGDSMVAGIIFAIHQGMSLSDSLRFGVACGTAATLNPGTELCYKADAEALFPKVIA